MPENKRTASGALGGIVGLVGLSAVAGLLVTAAVTPAIAVSGAAASSAITIFDKMPSYLQPDELMQPTTLMAGDQVLAKFFDQNRSPVTFDQVNPVMYDAILSSEDPRYYQHGGVDLIGTTRALLSNASGGETQGGSSISQQYVKNVLVQRCERDAKAVEATDTTPAMTRDEALQKCALEAIQSDGAAGYQRKLQEMRYAVQLEKEYTKDQILLGYLNIANFGGVTYGIDAAAKRYFNVPASQLNVGQAAVLAGMVQNPNRFRIDIPEGSINDGTTAWNKAPDGSIDDVDQGTIQALYTLRDNGEITQEQLVNAADGYSETKGRQLYVLSRMEADGKITHEQYVQFAIEPITPQITSTDQGCVVSAAPYFCQYVVATILNDPAFGTETDDRVRALRQDGLTIQTTLDWRVQDAAQQAMNDNAPAMYANMDFGSTAVSLEAGTGRVLAIAQNTKFTQDPAQAEADPSYNSIVFAGDSTYGGSDGFNAGSTFKLFTLVDWVEKGHSLNENLNGRLGPVPNMTNSCTGDWINFNKKDIIQNFGNNQGYVGTPLRFTRDSLNTGYLAMASELDLCDIAKTAKKLGVTRGNGTDIDMAVANNVIGNDPVSPLAMAGAYATVANGGTHCQPKVIDKVTDSDGAERKAPVRECSPALTSDVAASVGYALQGVMASGGTGSSANPYDGTPVLGKTGTHEGWNTWMIESSTKVTTAVWVGNWRGIETLFGKYWNGQQLSDMRYSIARAAQSAADEFYGGDRFPDPPSNALRTQQRDLPNVVGQSIDSARSTLENAGFRVSVGDPVDADFGNDRVAAQNPGGGSAPAGSVITLSPGNGQGGTVPDVAGQPVSSARAAMLSAGYGTVSIGSCSKDEKAPAEGQVVSTNPAGGSSANKSTNIALTIVAKDCPS
ncbi:transglycosylase domain-containing protein [Microbacterium sp. KSW4-17]|uniref:Transglycosylase domain-containing protein n=1 Tax=Microbacterium galbum TaxID=3075994 RepID=A0ABU3T8H7_9MICO|nr:transglycosylase domain-containing protein [Microbacterium sp. KSW4-17]MDU0367663.1 transglycosylase domain-containing protein [Microbacterium sp. KSW4-17]